jgi:hypothetical protein
VSAGSLRSAAELTQELRARLLLGCNRFYHGAIRGLHVRIVETTTVIHCASLADRMRVLDGFMGAALLRCRAGLADGDPRDGCCAVGGGAGAGGWQAVGDPHPSDWNLTPSCEIGAQPR